MKSISYYLKLLTYLLMAGSILIIVKKILSIIKFKTSLEQYFLLGVNLPNSMSTTFYALIIFIFCSAMIYLIYNLNIFRRVIIDFYNDLIFSKKNGKQLKLISSNLIIFTIILGILKLFLGIYFFDVETSGSDMNTAGFILGYTVANTIFLTLPLFALALIISLISELILKGHLIKNENDLTI